MEASCISSAIARLLFQRSQHSLRRHECIWVIIACVIVTLSGLPRLIYYAELELHYWVSVLYISKLKERMGRRSFRSISAVNHVWCMSSYSTFTCSLYYKWYFFFIFFSLWFVLYFLSKRFFPEISTPRWNVFCHFRTDDEDCTGNYILVPVDYFLCYVFWCHCLLSKGKWWFGALTFFLELILYIDLDNGRGHRLSL